METGKSSNSSDNFVPPENDHRPENSTGDSAGVGRSYECTFCKRGFTNAQALGGHMNIHRRDKAKAKQKNRDDEITSNTPSNVSKPQENIPHHHQYQMYLPPPPPPRNPNFQTGDYLPPLRRLENYDHRRVGHVADLSLRIGLSTPTTVEGGEAKENDDDVDLELRL
ncbi:hypothetical protein ABFS82_07G043300 [Erythranthe guttata]|uniref:C2H2-type domain-containing protein n=1 Tax=Erythranthe guttata TaxID=4155 RepID=A0A022QYI1_ERYGU|nr:PREDICTED: transcriptional regulator TAC1 [Erythranthe guttata]EYU32971.1 hypothetical protein MIMGU_mgv1a021877mg [Erythranthe guttata]|eukprot:XP_012842704.1 PREDICTED: transcriptional regulator TAC1 [Erythranthe guttata]